MHFSTSGGISVISFPNIIGSFSPVFSLTTGIMKNYCKQLEIKRRKMMRLLC